ncbi:MAG: TonB-dependent receptor [Verrucomicrobiota bacterium]
MKTSQVAGLAAGLWLLVVASVIAQPTATNVVNDVPARLINMSIEELMNIPVTLPTGGPKKLAESAAAVTVITGEDIRRSGVTSIPEALRLAPGLNVARVDSHTWAISSRGFNDVFANKLLVLIDGRSVYTPLFSGVYWDVQDTLLEDVDRVEVIRGPGASLWGANAVNGVINIITKTARESQGLLVTGGGGTEERGFGAIRYGGKLGEDVFYRAYVKYFNRDDSALRGGGRASDAWDMVRGGFRTDWEASDENLLTLQGDIYYGRSDQVYTAAVPPSPPATPPSTTTVPGRGKVDGGNVLGRWTRTFSEDANLRLQLYYDHTSRDSLVAYDSMVFKEVRDTFDVDAQHRFAIGDWQNIAWGLGYRVSSDDIRTNFTAILNPDGRTTHLLTAFFQDEIKLVEDRLHLTVGSKFEHNDYTGFEVQPSTRIVWTPHERHTIWGAVSRAVRTPSRAEDDVQLNLFQPAGAFPFPAIAAISGSRKFGTERMMAYELGYRVQLHERVSLDAALFYNVYTHLRSAEFQGFSSPPPLAVINSTLANNLFGESYGGELAATWKPLDKWRLRASYSYLDLQLHRRSGSTDTGSENAEGSSPHHQFTLQSSVDLPGRTEFDCAVRYVDNLPNPSLAIPAYLTLDVRFGWKPRENLEFSIVGQNLLDNRHPEFRPTIITTQSTEVERSVYAKVTWRF